MNIATITCHDVYNVGASLQAYALAEYLRRQGHTPAIIDYKPPYLSTHYRLWGCSSPAFDRPVLRQLYSLCKLPGRIWDYFSPRKRAFDQFRAQYLPLTPQRYASAAQLEQCPPQAQVYLAGSDQIWNTRFPNGKDPAFYLTFAPSAGVRASYAASFATKEVEPEQREQVRTWLRQLDFISVRERSGVDILTRLGVAGGIQVCDPVFLLPRSHWESIAPAQPEGDYLLVYDFDRNPKVAEISRQLARERGWKIYTIFFKQIALHPVAGERFEGERRDKLAGAARHHHAHVCPRFFQPAGEVRRLVGGDAPRHAQGDVFARKHIICPLPRLPDCGRKRSGRG